MLHDLIQTKIIDKFPKHLSVSLKEYKGSSFTNDRSPELNIYLNIGNPDFCGCRATLKRVIAQIFNDNLDISVGVDAKFLGTNTNIFKICTTYDILISNNIYN
jgi:hypothetical protein